jgi:hypothetical protein
MQSLIQLCDEGLHTQNSLNVLKHCLSGLLAAVHFLHLNILRGREAKRKLFLPFIDFYFKTRFALQGAKGGYAKSNPLKKVRVCIIMVIALRRMEKGAKEVAHGGLYRYVEKAIKCKGRIDDLSGYLNNLL